MIDIALVSYINTRPFMDGIGQEFGPDEARFHLMPPAECARFLQEKKCDLSLVPIGALPMFDDLAILPHYCLGANGPVESVYLFSQKPLESLNKVILDRHSRSSNGLVQILMKHFWKKSPDFIQAEEKHFHLIEGDTGGVVIGDHAIRIRKRFKYAYDLSEAWKKMTGLSFVFAVWAYRPGSLGAEPIHRLHNGLKKGVSMVKETALRWAQPFDLDEAFSIHYLQNCMDYHFDAPKHRALDLYTDLLNGLETRPYSALDSLSV